ncbi:MAG: helix-turn-helix transcriptional regulator [Nitrosopumilaceae archaeon]
MNTENYEEAAEEFLELASQIRLNILFELLKKKSRVTPMAKKLGATAQEVHRNFDRMSNSGFVAKDKDGAYYITTFGKAICSQIPSIIYLSKNKKYFENHNFGNLPIKFVRRMGDLQNSKHVTGVSRVLEVWKSIYKNADEYIFTVLSETPLELIELVIKRVKKGARYKHIISENAKIPKGRKKLLDKIGFYPLLEQGKIERRMMKDVKIMVILNEKEGVLMFPSKQGDADMREMFYSNDSAFHEWCLDYFRHCWNASDPFREFKLKE